jgi:chemotaxis protein MotB
MIYRPKYTSPVIIKTVIKTDDNAHRGHSWKIAYADLMTAMMAFFLFLWLYSVMTNQQKTQIANYFTPSVGVFGESGAGANGGKDADALKGTSGKGANQDGLTRAQAAQGPLPQAPTESTVNDEQAEQSSLAFAGKSGGSEPLSMENAFMAMQSQFNQLIHRTQNDLFTNNLRVDTTRDVIISLVNTAENPMFDDSRGELTHAGIQTMDVVANLITRTQRKFVITGFTTTPAVSINSDRQWDRSVQHANMVLRFLLARHISDSCIERVSGQSKTLELGSGLEGDDRVMITLLRDSCVVLADENAPPPVQVSE